MALFIRADEIHFDTAGSIKHDRFKYFYRVPADIIIQKWAVDGIWFVSYSLPTYNLIEQNFH